MARIPIRMPKMSMTMTEGEVSEWFVQPGDTISEGDVICEVLTDKVDMEVESPASGTLISIDVESGVAEVGVPIGWLEGEDVGGLGDLLAPDAPDDAAADDAVVPADRGTPTAAEPVAVVDAPVPTPTPSSAAGPVAAVPRARATAREHDIDLAELVGSGPSGLIVMADVEARISVDGAPAAAGPPTARMAAATTSTSTGSKRSQLVRARVAAKMTESATVPQFTLWRDLDLEQADRGRAGLSWTTVLLRAYAAALRAVPKLLCRWEDGAAVEAGPPSIGLAVDTPDGLLAPVLVAPDDADPAALDSALRQLVRTAQAGRVDAGYLQVANGMLSNLGSLGVDRFQALVTPPQGSVLAVGAIGRRPVAVPGGLGTVLGVTVGLTIDHRIADGADGARLLQRLQDVLDSSS